MTKPISRKMAIDCLLFRFKQGSMRSYRMGTDGFSLLCGICGLPLEPEQNIQFDHIHADVHGGPHEYQNLRPVHAECHKKKTKADVQANAKVKRLANPKPSKHPLKSSGRKIPSRSFPKRSSVCPPSK